MPLTVANVGFVKMSETLAAHVKAAYINRPDVTLVVDPNGNHMSAASARRLPNALCVLFGASQ